MSIPRLVGRWRPHDEPAGLLEERLVWRPASSPEPLTVELSTLFRDVLDED